MTTNMDLLQKFLDKPISMPRRSYFFAAEIKDPLPDTMEKVLEHLKACGASEVMSNIKWKKHFDAIEQRNDDSLEARMEAFEESLESDDLKGPTLGERVAMGRDSISKLHDLLRIRKDMEQAGRAHMMPMELGRLSNGLKEVLQWTKQVTFMLNFSGDLQLTEVGIRTQWWVEKVTNFEINLRERDPAPEDAEAERERFRVELADEKPMPAEVRERLIARIMETNERRKFEKDLVKQINAAVWELAVPFNFKLDEGQDRGRIN